MSRNMNNELGPSQGGTERATQNIKKNNVYNNAATMDSSNTGGNTVEEISNPTAVTGSIPNCGEPTIPSTIVETLAVKDRSKNGSEPIGGLSKGQLLIKNGEGNQKTGDASKIQYPNQKSQTVMNSPSFMVKQHNSSVPAEKTAVDSIDPEE